MRSLFTVLVASLCMVSCVIDSGSDDYRTGLLESGTIAPDFTMSSSDSVSFKLSSLRGSYVLIEFWASWCPDCQKAVPMTKQIYETYAPMGLVMLGVSFDNDKKQWQAYIEENGLDWIQHIEEKPWKESEVADEYNIKWIPTYYLIAPDGRVDFATVDVEAMADTLSVRIKG